MPLISHRSIAARHRPLLLVLVAALVLFGGGLKDSDLHVDSLRYAAVSKAFLTGGSLIVPHMGDVPFFNKPPLFFWLTAFSFSLFGISVWSAKMVSVLASVGAAAGVFAMARRLFGDAGIGCMAAMAFCLSRTIYTATNACRMESLLALATLASLGCFYAYLHRGQGVHWLLGWGAAAGAGMLAKGLPGLLPLGAGVIYLVLFGRGLHSVRLWASVGAGVLAMLAICGPWYGFMLATTQFYDVFFGFQTFARFFPSYVPGNMPEGYIFSEAYRTHPIYHYLVSYLRSNFYLLPFVVWGGVQIWRHHRKDEMVRLLAVFAVLTLVAIHGLSTKYGRYLYTIVMVLSLPAGLGLSRLLRIDGRRAFLTVALSYAVFLALWPGSLHSRYYTPLSDINAMSRSSRLPVVVSPAFFEQLAGRASASFFLDTYRVGAPRAPCLYVTDPTERTGTRPLIRTRKVHVDLVGAGPLLSGDSGRPCTDRTDPVRR